MTMETPDSMTDVGPGFEQVIVLLREIRDLLRASFQEAGEFERRIGTLEGRDITPHHSVADETNLDKWCREREWCQLRSGSDMPPMSREDRAINLLDDIIVLFGLAREDRNVIHDAMGLIAEKANSDPDFRVTASLLSEMRKQGLVK
jgi:hypothetical protein